MENGEIDGGVDRLSVAVPIPLLSRDELVALVRERKVAARRQAATGLRLVAELTSRGVAQELGCRDTRVLLQQLLLLSPDEAGQRVRDADRLAPLRAVTGLECPPIYAVTADAVGSGEISVRHARVITATIEALPSRGRDEHGDSAG